jgi:hypothetical protein
MTRAGPFLDRRKRELFVMAGFGERKAALIFEIFWAVWRTKPVPLSLASMHGPLAPKLIDFYILFPAAQQKIYCPDETCTTPVLTSTNRFESIVTFVRRRKRKYACANCSAAAT